MPRPRVPSLTPIPPCFAESRGAECRNAAIDFLMTAGLSAYAEKYACALCFVCSGLSSQVGCGGAMSQAVCSSLDDQSFDVSNRTVVAKCGLFSA